MNNPPPGAPVPPILPPQEGFLFLDRSRFVASFAADVNADEAAFMAASQVPSGVGAISAPVTTPAWRTKPSWYLMTTADKMIAPALQQVDGEARRRHAHGSGGSHAIFISKPDMVASVIEKAPATAAP